MVCRCAEQADSFAPKLAVCVEDGVETWDDGSQAFIRDANCNDSFAIRKASFNCESDDAELEFDG